MTRNEQMLSKFRESADEINERLSQTIENHRKAHAAVTVVNKDGEPISGAKLHIKHAKHEFLHGANIFMLDELETEQKNNEYKRAFADCFNAATLPFYWGDLEPEEGKPRYSKDSPRVYRRPSPDLCLEYCEANGITPKAHCLTYIPFEPNWLNKNDLTEVRAKYEKRYRELSERYADRIHGWEVINETLVTSKKSVESPFFNEKELVEECFALAEKYFPNNELIINETGEYVWGYPHFNVNRSNYYMIIERALSKGARIDCIGIQNHGFKRRQHEHELLNSIYDPKQIYLALDQYAEFGLPIQITEITIPAYSYESEDLKTQAEILEWLYKIWFGHPSVEGAMYWNMVDGYAAWATPGDMTAGENYYHGGLLDFNMQPKPAYTAIRRLFKEEWTTDVTLCTDKFGCAEFIGFLGEYDIEINGKIHKAKLSRAQSEAIKITI